MRPIPALCDPVEPFAVALPFKNPKYFSQTSPPPDAYLQLMRNIAHFHRMLQVLQILVLHINRNRMIMMNVEALMRRGVLMVDLMVML